MAEHVVKTELEVRWGECDPAGIVYHPAYIDWFSVARMHLLSGHGVSYMQDFHANGIVVVVLGVQCQYRKTLQAEDNITVEAWFRHLSRTRMGVGYRVLDSEGNLCAHGETEHAFVDMRQRPVNVAKRSPALWDMLCKLPIAEAASEE